MWRGLISLYLAITTCESESRSVFSDSLWLHGLYSPWNSLGQNTGVGSLSLLQGIFPTQGSNQSLPHCTWILYNLWFHLNKPSSLTILEANHVHSFTLGNSHFGKIPLVVDYHKRWSYHSIRLNHFLNRMQVLVYSFHNLMNYFVWPVEVCTSLGASRPVLEIDVDKWLILRGVRPVLEGWNHCWWRTIAPGICFLNWIMNGRRRELGRREVEGRLRSPGVEGTNRVPLFKGRYL